MGEKRRGGSGGGALAFSSGIFLSVDLSFSFLSASTPPHFSLRGWRHGYQDSLGTDNMAQTMASSPRWWQGRGGGGVGERREKEEREAGGGPQGKRKAERRISLLSTDALLNYSTPSPSHTFSLSSNTHKRL